MGFFNSSSLKYILSKYINSWGRTVGRANFPCTETLVGWTPIVSTNTLGGKVNFEHGTKLAKYQDRLFNALKEGRNITFNQEHIERLEGNLWIRMAEDIAPSNLVVRQLCLIDILNSTPKNRQKIIKQLNLLAPGQRMIWAEGYSYWEYTRGILMLWKEKFELNRASVVSYIINTIDDNFVESSYLRDGKIYPAPFGDLRDIPLREELQNNHTTTHFRGTFLIKDRDKYKITPYILGGNTHTPAKKRVVKIQNGYPNGFMFYKGYDKKYRSRTEEWKDIIFRLGSKI